MLTKSLLLELQHEADGTRKLFDAIPDDILDYRPNDFNWTVAELASHVAHVYHWWDPTLHQDIFELSTYTYDKGDITNMDAMRSKLDENIKEAIESLQDFPEEKYMDIWKMQMNGVDVIPPMPRISVIRSFLMSHLYHHRGELIAYLRVNHKPVPGLYGPTYEEQQAMQNSSSQS